MNCVFAISQLWTPGEPVGTSQRSVPPRKQLVSIFVRAKDTQDKRSSDSSDMWLPG